LLNSAPPHVILIWGSGGKAERIFNLGTRYVWVQSFTP